MKELTIRIGDDAFLNIEKIRIATENTNLENSDVAGLILSAFMRDSDLADLGLRLMLEMFGKPD